MIDLRKLPSVDRLLLHAHAAPMLDCYGRSLVTTNIQNVLESIRQNPQAETFEPTEEAILERVKNQLIQALTPTLTRVINASGVVLHTNLGRAPLSRSAQQAMSEIAGGYASLEYDLEKGKRGYRSVHASGLLRRLTGAEDALVVNNNAAAVLLCLSALASRRAVVISRSQLVEIGGGFRIPEVMKQSGARLVEIGTTNRVNLGDYESALRDGAALLMRAHTSNFKLVGFTSQPELKELTALAHQYEVPMLDDLGSGALLDTSRFGLAHEPMVQESLAAEVDLVCFSGDKLLGGPQAGIILGKAHLVAKIKRHPLARAVRADKLCLAGLEATLLHYLKGEAEKEIPIWRMISASANDLKERATRWQQQVGGEVVEERSTVGGGSLPEETLPTFALSFNIPGLEQMAARLRQSTPPLIARVQGGRLYLDPRTVLPEEDEDLVRILRTHITGAHR